MKGKKRKGLLIGLGLVVLAVEGASLGIYPQAGMEYYFGANRFRSSKPWAGIRLSLSPFASALLKYTFHDLSFNYIRDDGTESQRKAGLSQFIGAIYYARGKLESYGAICYFRGTDDYTAWNLDAGAGWMISKRVGFEAGFYLLDESSILWYPDEAERRIQVGALRGGLNINLGKGLKLNPQVYFYRNSEAVTAITSAVTLIFVPREPFTFVLTFWNYRESTQYRFSGNYISIGLHLYY